MIKTKAGSRARRTRAFWALTLAFLALVLPGSGNSVMAEATGGKVALVIGNASYQLHDPLPTARQDTARITDSLRVLGFDVIEANDVNSGSFRAALKSFSERLSPDDLAVFYYMGYAVQVRGRNFLLPLGAELRREFDLLTRSVPLDSVKHLMEAAATRANVIILDAAYADRVSTTQPWASGGLGEARPATGTTLTVFSAAPNRELPPPDERGSLFARELQFVLGEPPADLKEALRSVAGRVEVASSAEQRPWLDPSFNRSIPLRQPGNKSESAVAAARDPEPSRTQSTTPDSEVTESEATEAESKAEPAQHSANALGPEELGKAYEASLSPADRSRIQRDLRTLELYSGAIDRQFGPGTRRGISGLQTQLGDPSTGYLTVAQDSALAALAEERRSGQLAAQESEEDVQEKQEADKTPPRRLSEVERVVKLAEQGDSRAQANLGVRYFHGRGVEKDYEKARFWYLKAAEQGETSAQTNLGFIYFNGYGVERDLSEAAKWLRAAAEQGQREAQYNLGMLYENGSGVPRNYEEAAKWYGRAAELGIAEANQRIDYLKQEQLIE